MIEGCGNALADALWRALARNPEAEMVFERAKIKAST
jgi:hypothetical protein